MSDPISTRIIDVKFQSAPELEKAYQDNISKGGYFVPTDDPAPRTTPVEVRFHLPGIEEPFSVRGEVAYAATPDSPMPGMGAGMAIQFQDVSPNMSTAFMSAITIAKSEGIIEEDEAEGAEADSKEDSGTGPKEKTDEKEAPDNGPGSEEPEEGAEEDKASSDRIMATLNQQTSENIYFTIRKMPLHQKIVAAKRGNRNIRNILLQEGNKKILQYLIQNPQMSVPEVIQMLKLSSLPLEVIKLISKNSNWSQSEEVKYCLVTNPKTPLPLSLNLLSGLNVHSLAKLAKSGAIKVQLKSNALKLLELRRRGS